MHCGTCGTTLPDGAKFCGACGTTQAAPAAAPAPAPAPVPAPAPAPAPVPAPPAPVEAAPAYQEPAAQPVFQEQPAYQAPPAAPPVAAAPVFQQQPVYQQPAAPVYQQQPAYQQPPAAAPAAAVAAAAPAEPPPPKGSIYAPISGLGYIGYFILFAIPLVGQILCIAFAFSKSGNVNRRNLAKAMFVMLIIALVFGLIVGVGGFVTYRRVVNDPSLAQSGIFSVIPGLSSGGGSSSGFPFSFGGGGEGGGGSEGYFSEGGDGGGTPSPQSEGGGNPFGQMFSSDWPNNEFTKQVPKPKFTVSFGDENESEYSALCNASIAEIKAYVKDLQKAGFTRNASTTDESIFGMAVYSYEAVNDKGYRVSIGNAMGITTFTISREFSPS